MPKPQKCGTVRCSQKHYHDAGNRVILYFAIIRGFQMRPAHLLLAGAALAASASATAANAIFVV
jgi:hypothetical protein